MFVQAFEIEGQELPAWTTKDGEEIPITDMSDDHLMNAIRWMRRAAKKRMRKDWKRDRPKPSDWKSYLSSKYIPMVREAIKRNLVGVA